MLGSYIHIRERERTYRGVLVRSTADLEEVDPSIGNGLQLLDAVVQVRLGLVVDAVLLDADGEALGRGRPHGPDDLHDDLGPLGRAAAVRVRPGVGLGAQELREQVPVRGVDLDAVEAGLGADPRRPGEPRDDVLDLGDRHLLRRAEHDGARQLGQDAVAQVQGDRRRREVLLEEAPGAGSERRLPPGVVDLDDGGVPTGCALACLGPGLPRLEHLGLVVDERRVLWPAEVLGVHLHVTREHQAPAALGPGGVGAVQGLVGQVIRLRAGHLLRHGRIGEAVGEDEP